MRVCLCGSYEPFLQAAGLTAERGIGSIGTSHLGDGFHRSQRFWTGNCYNRVD